MLVLGGAHYKTNICKSSLVNLPFYRDGSEAERVTVT